MLGLSYSVWFVFNPYYYHCYYYQDYGCDYYDDGYIITILLSCYFGVAVFVVKNKPNNRK